MMNLTMKPQVTIMHVLKRVWCISTSREGRTPGLIKSEALVWRTVKRHMVPLRVEPNSISVYLVPLG